jgi:hypothetical protein
MKKLFLLIVIVLFCKLTFAQVPESFNYQAIPRDVSGEVYSNQLMKVRINILAEDPEGSSVYTETFSTTTTSLGLLNLQIGQGEPVSGTFSAITWGSTSYYLKVEIDPTGGTSYIDMGITQLISVPYAMYAKTAENFTEIDPKVGSNTENYLSKWNGSALVTSSIFDNGNIGIGLTDPSNKLSVSGNIYASDYVIGTRLYVGDDEYFFRDAEDLIKTDDSFEVSRIGINHDPSSTYELYVSGQAYVADYMRADGGIHVGGSSDPGTDNLIVNGETGLGGIDPERNLHVYGCMRLQPISYTPSSPSEGDIYMNSTTHKLMVYDGTTWQACW